MVARSYGAMAPKFQDGEIIMIRRFYFQLLRECDLMSLKKGGLAEWSNAPHSKCGWGEIPSEVRILHPPQIFGNNIKTQLIL